MFLMWPSADKGDTAPGQAAPGTTPAAIGGDPLSATPATQPAVATKTPQQLYSAFGASRKQLDELLPQDVLTDPTKYADLAPKAIKLAYENLEAIDQMAASKKFPPAMVDGYRQHDQSILYLMKDPVITGKVDDMLASQDEGHQLNGRIIQLQSQWITVKEDKNGDMDDKNKQVATKVVDEVESLDKAHPKNSKLATFTLNLGETTGNKELSDRLIALVTDVLTAPEAKQFAAQKKFMDDAVAKLKATYEDKPMVITGKTVDGKDFTTADMKGKVILVDFWATWCGPCVAGLPDVIETYSKYHDQGLEILGVDNDQKASDVTKFTEKHKMEWPQLFEPSTDPKNRFSPNTQQFGIVGIPTMFLIDKKGICRSVEAREKMKDLIPKLLAE